MSPNARCSRFADRCRRWNSARSRSETVSVECFQHVAEAFGLDPHLVTAWSTQRLQVPSLVHQSFMPPIEFARAVGFQSLLVLTPLITLQPRSLLDPARQCPDKALCPNRAQAANQAAIIQRLPLIDLLADHALRPCVVSLPPRIFHEDIIVARGAERAVQPGNFLLQTQPLAHRPRSMQRTLRRRAIG